MTSRVRSETRGRSMPAGWTVRLVLVLMAAALACSRSTEEADRSVVVTGSSTLAPLIGELARDYERTHPGVRIDVQSGGSSRGILDVRSGRADIGMVSRDLTQQEAQRLHVHPIARDGVGIILHSSNPVQVLTRDQVVAVYRGEIDRWRELGGADAPIVVVHKAEGRATRTVFLAHFGLESGEVEPDVVVGENEQAVKTVAGNPDAIGYVSIGTAAIDIARGVPIRMLPIDGVPATLESLAGGRYAIARALNLITRGPASGLARELIDFIRSPAATPRFEAQHFLQLGE